MSDLIQLLLQPFSFGFMQQAFVITLLVAIPMGLLSPFLVLKGWSLMGDAISHAVLPGVVLAYIAGIPLAIGAFAAGMICALATGFLKQNSRVKEDTVMGVVFSGMFGLGIVLYTKIQSDVHLDHILFGDMLGVAWRDIAETGVIAAVTLLALGIWRRDLLLHAFDPQHAQAIGLPVKFLHYGLLCILSLTIVGALKAVGIILAVAMLIAPGSIAFLLTKRFGTHAARIGTCCRFNIVGRYLSEFLPRQRPGADHRTFADGKLHSGLCLLQKRNRRQRGSTGGGIGSSTQSAATKPLAIFPARLPRVPCVRPMSPAECPHRLWPASCRPQ
jgi:manganese/iron transport system permease protein